MASRSTIAGHSVAGCSRTCPVLSLEIKALHKKPPSAKAGRGFGVKIYVDHVTKPIICQRGAKESRVSYGGGYGTKSSFKYLYMRECSLSEEIHHGSWELLVSPKESRTLEESCPDDNVDAKSVCVEDAGTPNGHPSSSQLHPALDSTVFQAKDLVPETVEVAVQTVSSVGEIEGPIIVEQASLFQGAALKTVLFWVSAAVTFGIFIGLKYGAGRASEFFAGYLVEQSLSVDNLFVFVVIFRYFQVPTPYHSRVLTYGITGAVIFRGIMILLGVTTIQRFEAVNLIFASLLIFTSYKLLSEQEEVEDDFSKNFIVNTCKKFIAVTEQYDGNKFYTEIEGTLKATPLFLTLAVVELSDIAFAIDSIPAVFGVTKDPLIVFSSNIFAILGLRSLYTLISTSIDELDYLQPSIAVVLGFIGSKMTADFFGFHVTTEVSLAVVVSLLGTGIGLSLLKKKRDSQKRR